MEDVWGDGKGSSKKAWKEKVKEVMGDQFEIPQTPSSTQRDDIHKQVAVRMVAEQSTEHVETSFYCPVVSVWYKLKC